MANAPKIDINSLLKENYDAQLTAYLIELLKKYNIPDKQIDQILANILDATVVRAFGTLFSRLSPKERQVWNEVINKIDTTKQIRLIDGVCKQYLKMSFSDLIDESLKQELLRRIGQIAYTEELVDQIQLSNNKEALLKQIEQEVSNYLNKINSK